ncbi:MAG: hypothetical protein R2865_01415 [Deinococcales bacterium]
MRIDMQHFLRLNWLLALIMFFCQAQTQLSIATGGTGNYYPTGGAYGELISKYIPATAQRLG